MGIRKSFSHQQIKFYLLENNLVYKINYSMFEINLERALCFSFTLVAGWKQCLAQVT